MTVDRIYTILSTLTTDYDLQIAALDAIIQKLKSGSLTDDELTQLETFVEQNAPK